MLARVSVYEARPTDKLQIPTAPAQTCCGFLRGRRESEFNDQASPEAAGAPGRQREEAETSGRPTARSVAGWVQGQGGGLGSSACGDDPTQPVRTPTAGLT